MVLILFDSGRSGTPNQRRFITTIRSTPDSRRGRQNWPSTEPEATYNIIAPAPTAPNVQLLTRHHCRCPSKTVQATANDLETVKRYGGADSGWLGDRYAAALRKTSFSCSSRRARRFMSRNSTESLMVLPGQWRSSVSAWWSQLRRQASEIQKSFAVWLMGQSQLSLAVQARQQSRKEVLQPGEALLQDCKAARRRLIRRCR